jgi:tetratricopeptide (TPR) repeat protein
LHQFTELSQTPSPNTSINESKLLTLLLSCLGIYSILRVLFLFVDEPLLWGINLLHYLPLWVGVVLLLCALGAIALSRNIKTSQSKDISKNRKSKSEPKETRNSSSYTYLLIGIAALLGVLFLVFRITWPFLGDGTIYFGFMFNFQAYGVITTQRTATPVLYLLYGVYYIFLKLANNDLNVFFPFTVMSFVSGTLFVTFSFLFAKAFTDNNWLRFLIISLLMTLGGSLLFFGYIETYPLQYACVLIYAYYSYQYLQHKAKLTPVAFALLLCIAFHIQHLLLLPSFVLLFSLKRVGARESSDKSRLVKNMLIVASPLMFIVYWLFQSSTLGISPNDPYNPFIPFASSSYSRYSLFNGLHLLDILNEHLLLAPVPIIIIAVCLIVGRTTINWKHPFVLYLLLNLFFVEAFLVGGNLMLGIARDWDVCSSLGISFALLAAVLLKEILPSSVNIKRIAIPISIVGLSVVIPWIALNVRIASAVERYEDILSMYTPIVNSSIARVSYENLRKYYLNNDVDGELRTVRKMMELEPTHIEARIALIYSRENAQSLSPYAKVEVLRISELIAQCNDSLLRQETFDKVRVGESHSGENVTLGDFFGNFITFLYKDLSFIDYEDAQRRTQAFISAHPALPYGHEQLGYMLMMYSKNNVDAITNFEKAIALDTMRARPYLYYALALSREGRPDEANAMYRKSLTLDPKWMTGVTLYILFLTDENNANVNIGDLEWMQTILDKIITTPPESTMEFHRDEYDQRIGTAKQLLSRVEKRLKELQKDRAGQ